MVTLDVGCGKRTCGDIGIDYNRNSDADVIADAEHLPFKDEAFTETMSTVVLEHSPNPLNFLMEQHRTLKQNGRIELVTDNAQCFRWSVLKFRGQKHEDYHTDHYMIFYPENVARLMRLAGFNNIVTEYVSKEKFKMGVPFALLVKVGLFRKECMYKRFRAIARKKKQSRSLDLP
jgi:SAM-dependent methyltransferase